MLRNLSASSIASFSSYENQLIRNDSTNDLTNDDETPTRVIIETINSGIIKVNNIIRTWKMDRHSIAACKVF